MLCADFRLTDEVQEFLQIGHSYRFAYIDLITLRWGTNDLEDSPRVHSEEDRMSKSEWKSQKIYTCSGYSLNMTLLKNTQ